MFEALLRSAEHAAEAAGATLWGAVASLLAPGLIAIGLGYAARRRQSLQRARAAAGEITTNLCLFGFDVIVVTPLLALLLAAMGAWMQRNSIAIVHPHFWSHLPAWLTGFLAIFIGDFIGYWRHRLEHTTPLWPAHAVHHSDTAMTWTTIFRFHPINRLSTALIDTGMLALFGFPPWALALNNIVRHYYGMLDHIDLPWSFGPLGRIFVSPVMHRWHHIREAAGAGVNFATVFSIFDQAFATYWAPGQCDLPLGVRDAIGQSALAQLWHPLKVFLRWMAPRRPAPEPLTPPLG